MLFLSFAITFLAILGSTLIILDCLAFGYGFQVFDSNRKVGGIRFLKIGRLNISLSISKGAAQ